MLCDRCNKEMIETLTKFTYLGIEFEETVPRCPECGQVYISSEIALGKMARVEEEFEEK